MRVPGTVSYPNRKKRAQGYIDELVVLSVNPNPSPFADISSWSNVLPKPAHRETFDIDLGKNSLDLNALKQAIVSVFRIILKKNVYYFPSFLCFFFHFRKLLKVKGNFLMF